ncbi:cupin domain-containing protein [Desulfocurvibacter africanus]|uniref:Cupin 2 conserved barrel domain protein n=1 Tax=Desulfocurvibacter africanus subsp. africanus str. Walvis Bay TaxID=690850 RepID=F3YVS4_DESAF|nr:cupin domain-containing protein [Desulfocurvibacter africanus]EGJ48882.1 Cupin 2 conserved barrel domain protein [Desulfocurvibacter africanus subsp. africanus str. Walvis Bay]
MNGFAALLENGSIMSQGREISTADIEWTPAAFPGVQLKHLLKAVDTDGRFSIHLVRVRDGHEIGDHAHATQHELHQVIEGFGLCVLSDREIDYAPGSCAVMPQGARHRVVAQGGDLHLLATFVPALL